MERRWIVVGAVVAVIAAATPIALALWLEPGGHRTPRAPAWSPGSSTVAAGTARNPSVFVDPTTGRTWSAWSNGELTIDDAGRFCLDLGGPWRLPTRSELQELLVEPTADVSALRPDVALDFAGPGFLWSGEGIGGSLREKWIMNLDNGHIFNGYGRTGLARCVH